MIVLRPTPISGGILRFYALHALTRRSPRLSFVVAATLFAVAVLAVIEIEWPTDSVPGQVLFVGLMAWAPFGIGTLLWSGLEDHQSRRRASQRQLENPKAAWAADWGWDATCIQDRSDANTCEATASLLLVAVLTAACVAAVAKEPTFGAILPLSVFVGLTAVISANVIPRLRSRWLVGRCFIVPSVFPLQPGTRTVLTIRSRRGLPVTPASLVLRLVQTRSGSDNSPEESVESWRGSVAAPGGPFEIECELDLPPSAPVTSIRDLRVWDLELRGTGDCSALRARFILPVYAVNSAG